MRFWLRIALIIFIAAVCILMPACTKPDGQANMDPEQQLSFAVPLNHFYLVLDGPTYNEILNNEFLKTQFAPLEQRTTVRRDQVYTGLYLYGQHTYFEFFNSGVEKARKLSDTGLAFAIEQPGGAKPVQAVLTKIDGVESDLVTRQIGQTQVPWFTRVAIGDFLEDSGINTWVMEYDPQFLAKWHEEIGGPQSITRADVLKRYVAVLPSRPADPLLGDVRELTIAMSPKTASDLAEMCTRLGYRSSREGGAIVLNGPDIVLHLVPESGSKHGLQEATFQLTRPAKKMELRFGSKSVLTIDGNTAMWTF
jgi:hypothetical protein